MSLCFIKHENVNHLFVSISQKYCVTMFHNDKAVQCSLTKFSKPKPGPWHGSHID